MTKRFLTYIVLFLLSATCCSAQYITSQGNYLEGTSYISTSRVQAFNSKNRYLGSATLSMDYISLSSHSYSMKGGEHFTIQINYFERNVGQTILLKTEDGKVIELNTYSVQRDPFVQVYWLKEWQINDIIKGKIVKIRIKTIDGYVDRDITGNTFSNAVNRCYSLLRETRTKALKSSRNFKKGF